MAVSINNKLIRFEDLRKLKDEKQERIYSKELIDELESGHFEFLNIINLTDRNNSEFMQPLVYAVRNSTFNTYEIFKYYGSELQKQDTVMQIEIAREEPEIFKETEIKGNDVIMLNLVHINPKVVKYISDDLKSDGEFIEDICKTGNSEAIEYVIEGSNIEELIKDNPNLMNNEEFMKEAIEQEPKTLMYANEELKDNYNFIKEVSESNYGVVEFVVDNQEKFGLETICATRDTAKELTIDDCIHIIDEMAENSEDKRYQKVKEKIQQNGIEDVRTMRWVTAMVAQSDNVSPEMLKKVLDYSMLTMSKLQKDLTKDENEKATIDNMQELITPGILNKLKEKAIQQGLEVNPELDVKLEKYTEFYNSYNEKLKVEKAKKRESEIEYKQEDVEKTTEAASLNGVKEEMRSNKKRSRATTRNKRNRGKKRSRGNR